MLRNLSLGCTVIVLTEHHWHRTSETYACDSQVGSKENKSGGCERQRGADQTVGHERAPRPHASPNPIRVPYCTMWEDVEEDTPAQPEEAPAEPAPAAEPAKEEAKPEEAEPPAPENATTENEAKKLVFKHWVRPKFLQYNYIYDYQHNYYDDLISYLDRRNKGLPAERPRAQTWGERALRTYLANNCSHSIRQTNKDTTLLRHISTGARFHRYHSKSLISRKYSRLGFNTVSI